MHLSEAWSLYEIEKTLEGYSQTTLRNYNIQVNLLVRHFGEKDVNEITVLDLKQYLIQKGSHLKPSSLGQRIRAIRAFFRWLADEGYIDRNPTAKLREPKLGGRVPKAYSEEEAELLREACKNPLEHALTELFFSTGCRISEVQQLNKSDIDWENRSCIVLGKGNKQREVYFSLKAKIWLRWYVDSRTDEDPALFVTERAPHRMSIATMRRDIKKVGIQSKIDRNVCPHYWRHTFAMHLLDRGAPIEAVQDQLGHVDLKTTRIYCQLSGARRKAIHNMYFLKNKAGLIPGFCCGGDKLLTVFNKLTPKATLLNATYGEAILENALEVFEHHVINGELTLHFNVPINDDKWEYIIEENIVKTDEGQLFSIKEITSSREGSKIVGVVKCEHIYFSALDEYITEIEIERVTASTAMSAIWNIPGIEFIVGFVELTTNVDYLYKMDTNPVEATKEIMEQCGGELDLDNFTVRLLNQLGSNNGCSSGTART